MSHTAYRNLEYWGEDRVLVEAQLRLPNPLLAPSELHLAKLPKEGPFCGQDPSSLLPHPLAWGTVCIPVGFV